MTERWTIEQLVPLVEQALDPSGYNGQHSGRVRSLPDLRTIRYYTTLGLLDPPAEMRGRKAFYGRRHLVQLVAIKRLQARRLLLAQVQQTLAGVDDRTLDELAALPTNFWQRATALGEKAAEAPAPTTQRHTFWAAEPAMPASKPQQEQSAPRLALHLPVADGVQLVLDGIDPARFTPEAIAQLKEPLESLAQILRNLQLTLNER